MLLLICITFYPLTGCSRELSDTKPPVSLQFQEVMIRQEADWIMNAVTEDGAIALHVDKLSINPYMGHFAAIALARATIFTGDVTYVNSAWKWLHWYAQHMNDQGFVTDYLIINAKPVSTGSMDSTDAYAALFLIAMSESNKALNIPSELESLHPALEKAVSAIEATMDYDGLTWAKPNHLTKYLMDASEVYAGLKAGYQLATDLHDWNLQNRIRYDLDQITVGIEGLWNPKTNAYDWAKYKNGYRRTCNWDFLYPDSLEQIWPIAFGVINGERATHLLTTFTAKHPFWDRPAENDKYRQPSMLFYKYKPVGYWAEPSWAYLRIGDINRVMESVLHIYTGVFAADRVWPFNIQHSAGLIILGTGGL